MAEANEKRSDDTQKCLWEIGFFRLSPKQQVTASQLRAALRTCANPLGPYLADVCKDSLGEFCKADVAAVESHLIAALKKEGAKASLRLLSSVIFNLKRRYQKKIPIPTRLDRLTKDPNLLPPNLSEVKRRVTAWTLAEKRWLEQQCGFAVDGVGVAPISWEMVIASAALRGGLVSVKRAVAFARALSEPDKHFGCSSIRGYVDMVLLTKGEFEEVVRWYPNNRLLLLISRVTPSQVQKSLLRCSQSGASASVRDRKIAQIIFDGIVAEFRHQAVDPGLLPRSLNDFVATIARYLRPELPSELIDYATGVVRGPSLLPGSSGRINGDPAVYVPRIQTNASKVEDGELSDLKAAYARNARSKQEPQWMCRLRTAFCETDVKQVIQAISAIERCRKTTPSGKQLCNLAKKLLTEPSYSGRTLSYAGIRCCILTVARRFALQRKDEDPATYCKTTAEELYRLTVDEAAEDSRFPQGLQGTVQWALRQYHRHLVYEYKAEEIDEGIAFRVAPGPDRADAHVLSVDEIVQVIEYIEASRNRRWKRLYRTIAVGQVVLFFLGGLRRAEGLGLLPSDLLPGPLCEVWVRDNDIRTLKSENSYRRVMLGVLAHPFPELLDPVHALFHEAGRLGTDLSCGVSEDVIVPIIHEGLQAVTGGQDCHIHSLRRSAAHWMFMRLMLADLDRVPNLFPHLPRTTLWLKASQEFRSLLLHNTVAMNDHSWAVAAMIGNSNPRSVTLRFYVCCLDLLLAHFLEARTKLGAPATLEELRRQSGLPRSTAYFQLPAPTEQNNNSNLIMPMDNSQDGDTSCPEPEKEFALKVFRERLGLSVHSNSRPSLPPPDQHFWPKDTYDMLWMSNEIGLSADRMATMFGRDRQDVVAMLSRADSILRIQGHRRCLGRVPRSGKVRSEIPKVLRPPIIGFDSKAFQRWSRELENHVFRCHDSATTAIDYMVSNTLPESSKTVFAGAPQPKLMQSCLGVLDALGFQVDDLDAISCDGTKHMKPSREWLRSWGLSWRITATNHFGEGRLLQVSPPWVAVGPKRPEETAILSLRDQADAIWFLIRMAAIRFVA
jgi:hypothetical protein